VQPESKQRQRLWRFMALKIIVMRPVLAMMYRFYNARGRDYQDDLANTVRDVVRLKTPRNLRCQPSATLLYEPRKFIDALRAAGFDAGDHTRTQHIPAPRDRPELEPITAAKSMRGLVVIPCYDAMPDSELARQTEVIRKVAEDVPLWKV
jgi:perosamine synthetase